MQMNTSAKQQSALTFREATRLHWYTLDIILSCDFPRA